ncbi:MAG TPA: NAD-dependent epimerase/dehydratase family protein [Myxococcota bacterium]
MNTTTHAPSLHVVLGAGQIGLRLARLLRERGHRVRLVQRGTSGKAIAQSLGIEHLAGDITDDAFAVVAGRGADVVYDCMNPPYHEWQAQLLKLGRGSLKAATSTSTTPTKLVALDCLYMYGKPNGLMREDHALNPCSKKGALRVQLAQLRLDAHARGDVRLAIGRASDFFGADLPYSLFNERFFQRLRAGKAGEALGDPDQLHSFSYADDVANALLLLGAHDDTSSAPPIWHLPTAPAITTRQLVTKLGAALGVDDARVAAMSPLLLRALGVFVPFMRELPEMAYQWQAPFVLDDTRFTSTFGVRATPVDEQVRQVAAALRARRVA